MGTLTRTRTCLPRNAIRLTTILADVGVHVVDDVSSDGSPKDDRQLDVGASALVFLAVHRD